MRYIITGIGSLLAFYFMGYYTGIDKQQKQPQIKPCNHLSPQQVILYHEKSERFIDELQRAKKAKRNALVDSVNHYRALSGINCNKIEY